MFNFFLLFWKIKQLQDGLGDTHKKNNKYILQKEKEKLIQIYE